MTYTDEQINAIDEEFGHDWGKMAAALLDARAKLKPRVKVPRKASKMATEQCARLREAVRSNPDANQAELAKMLGLTQASVSRYLRQIRALKCVGGGYMLREVG